MNKVGGTPKIDEHFAESVLNTFKIDLSHEQKSDLGELLACGTEEQWRHFFNQNDYASDDLDDILMSLFGEEKRDLNGDLGIIRSHLNKRFHDEWERSIPQIPDISPNVTSIIS